ncbi:MAG TPA: hypothetical protein VGM90_35715 [Kofleriaceae bacterium]|jgi:hypothetical protein
MNRFALASLLVSLLSASAFAQAPSDTLPPPPASETPLPSVAVTFSPIHLVIPFVEVTAEIRVNPKIGVAVTAGAGVTHVNESTTNDKITLYEGGISPRYYLTGSFRQGVQLGAEMQYLHASADSMSTVSAAGLSIGPYVGYKWTAAIGLTLEAQAGVAIIAVKGSNDTTGQTDGEKRLYPLLNLNAGWSF